MARYTRTDTASAKAHPNGVGTFIGWDALDVVSEEATYAGDLGLSLSAHDKAIFADLADGEVRHVGAYTYSRN